MPAIRELTTTTIRNINIIEEFAKDFRRKRVTPTQSKIVKKIAQETLAKLVKFTKTGNPINSLDRAIYQEIRKNGAQIKKEITTIMAKKEPTVADYYKIYYKILKDSGLSPVVQLRPDIVAKFTAALECDWCNACAACSICNACAVSLTAALGATGAVAGHATKAF